MTSLATVASFATPAASTRGHPSTTRRAPWRRPVSRGTTVVTRAATAEELEERLRQKEDQIHELRNELDLQIAALQDVNNVIQAAREKEQEAWRKVHDTEAKYQEGGDLMKELEAVRRERDERQANVNELQGKISELTESVQKKEWYLGERTAERDKAYEEKDRELKKAWAEKDEALKKKEEELKAQLKNKENELNAKLREKEKEVATALEKLERASHAEAAAKQALVENAAEMAAATGADPDSASKAALDAIQRADAKVDVAKKMTELEGEKKEEARRRKRAEQEAERSKPPSAFTGYVSPYVAKEVIVQTMPTPGDIDGIDERLWVPQTETISFHPLLFNVSNGYYVNLLRVKGAGVLSRHKHPGAVHGWVLRGEWRYLEHDWVAKEGSYVFEPPGETHTLVVPEGCDEMITMFHVQGSLNYCDERGDVIKSEDVFDKLDMARKHYESVGLGASYVDNFVR